MKQNFKVRRMVFAAFFVALGLILPQVFHIFGQGAGIVFSPMHLPVIIGGFICGSLWGMPIGAITVIVSSLLFAMPGFNPNGFSMIFELAAYGGLAGLFYGKLLKKIHAVPRLYVSLVLCMICGRIVSLAAKLIIYSSLGTDFAIATVLYSLFVATWPGILLQLIIIPPIVAALRRSALIGVEK